MNETYNYFEAVKNDIENYIDENDIFTELEMNPEESLQDIENEKERIYELLFVNDSVTGNASGSYFFNCYEAENALCHNLELLKEACDCFGCNCDILENPETCDVTIRCYLLSEALNEVFETIETELEKLAELENA